MMKVSALLVAASLSLSADANVITVDFASQSAPDGNNLVSLLLKFANPNFNQLGLSSGSLFWENFDVYDNAGAFK